MTYFIIYYRGTQTFLSTIPLMNPKRNPKFKCGLFFTHNLFLVILHIFFGIHRCFTSEKLKSCWSLCVTEGPTFLVYTGFHGGLEHLKIETRLIEVRGQKNEKREQRTAQKKSKMKEFPDTQNQRVSWRILYAPTSLDGKRSFYLQKNPSWKTV